MTLLDTAKIKAAAQAAMDATSTEELKALWAMMDHEARTSYGLDRQERHRKAATFLGHYIDSRLEQEAGE